MRIILISGAQGSGKTTLAKGLQAELGGVIINFADPLYEMQEALRPVAAKYGIPFEQKEGRLLQLLGTDWARTVKGENVWVGAGVNAVGEALSAGAPYVYVSDARFPNEVEAFKGRALTVRLEAPTATRAARTDGYRSISHVSETALDDYEGWDVVLDTGVFSKAQTLKVVLDSLRTAPSSEAASGRAAALIVGGVR